MTANFDVDSTLSWDGIHDAVDTLSLAPNVAELERPSIHANALYISNQAH